jgi:[NiFe] hydrogenase diaphorase moiety large subunit
MSSNLTRVVKEVCQSVQHDRTRLMDVAIAVQKAFGCVSNDAIVAIAAELKLPRVEVESLVTFYAFLSKQPKGHTVIRLCNDVIDEMNGVARVAEAFEQALGIKMGQTTPDGKVSLEYAPCIGMSDQAPAALVNDVVMTNLDAEKARAIVRALISDGSIAKLAKPLGDGNNGHDKIRSTVVNNIRQRGPVIFDTYINGSGLKKALAMTPAEVIRDVKTSRLRGRGGAGFPTGMKWDFTRQAQGAKRYVVCNADEGEPGTFKDRVVLTESADLLLEGMTVAGYAIGSDTGILYLRGEYAYLKAYLEDVLAQRRQQGLLGSSICGKTGFNFDIRIQMGAGAYVCGEETALLSSCEGLRGDPKNRPPFPAQKGYLGCPTTVNNAETFCCVSRILEKGPGWFAQIGSKGSAGTKLLSVSGDCARPGVYEVPFGIKLADFLKMAGGEEAAAVQMGGPSGRMVGPADFGKTICYDDLATGGSVMVFNADRDVVKIARAFMEFFVEESCGYCTPCRVGNALLRQKLDDLLAGHGEPGDLAYLEELGRTVKLTSRCGLGQTSANPVLSTLERFKPAYDALLKKTKKRKGEQEFLATFDIRSALATSEALMERKSEVFN